MISPCVVLIERAWALSTRSVRLASVGSNLSARSARTRCKTQTEGFCPWFDLVVRTYLARGIECSVPAPRGRSGSALWLAVSALAQQFYPPDLAQDRWLEYHASHFNTVEINNTFYRLPEATAFAVWKGRVPKDFLYAVKASQFLTHVKKLKDPEEPLERLFCECVSSRHHPGPCSTNCRPDGTSMWNDSPSFSKACQSVDACDRVPRSSLVYRRGLRTSCAMRSRVRR